MRVTPDSPVTDKDSYLFKWDTQARRYFDHFEIHKQSSREGVHRLFQNVLTRFKDPIQYRYRYQDIDTIVYRQLLGDISKDEVSELNKVHGSKQGSYYTKGWKEPASILAWKKVPLGIYWALGAGIAVYAKFVRGYNMLWFVAPFAPMWMYLFYQW